MKLIYRFFKIIIGLLLLPFCVGSILALWEVIKNSGSAQTIWIATLAGAVCWVLIYIFLPKPTWFYVLGHELTHALWSFLSGGKLKKIRVSSSGGHVQITKSNFLTSLAPYFFPFYVVIVILIFALGNLIWNWMNYVLIFYFLIGLAYAFHITLTAHALKTKQPDIVGEGYIFSAVIIFLGNMIVLLIGIPLLVGNADIPTVLHSWVNYSVPIYHSIAQYVNV